MNGAMHLITQQKRAFLAAIENLFIRFLLLKKVGKKGYDKEEEKRHSDHLPDTRNRAAHVPTSDCLFWGVCNVIRV